MILRRLPGERFSEVVPEWIGRSVAIFAGGPSLSAEQIAKVRGAGLSAIAVNDTYLLAPHAEVCYFADFEWWRWQTDGIARPALGLSKEQVRERFASFSGQKCSMRWGGMNIEDEAVHILRNKHGDAWGAHGTGLSLDPRFLVTGKNSGFQAINLAILAGAKRLLLFGFDGAADQNGRNHWFGENPRNVQWPTFYEYMRRSFAATEREIKEKGVEVINCNKSSRIDNFRKLTTEEALALEEVSA